MRLAGDPFDARTSRRRGLGVPGTVTNHPEPALASPLNSHRPRKALPRTLLALAMLVRGGAVRAEPTPAATPPDPPWRQAVRRLAEDQQHRLRWPESYWDKMAEVVRTNQQRSLTPTDARFLDLTGRLVKQQKDLIATYNRCWSEVLDVARNGPAPGKAAASLHAIARKLFRDQPALLEGYERLQAELSQLTEGETDPNAARATADLIGTARKLVDQARVGSVGLLDQAAPLYMAHGDLDTAWVVRRQQLVLERQLPAEAGPRIERARLALADIDLLVMSPPGEAPRLPELDRLDEEAERHLGAKEWDGAATALQARLKLIRELLGEADELTVKELEVLGKVHGERKDLAAAARAYKDMFDVAKQLYPPTHGAVTFARLAWADAERSARGGRDLRPRLPELDELTAKIKQAKKEGRKPDALRLMRQQVRLLREMLGDKDLIVAEALCETAALSYELKDYRAARNDLREAQPIETKDRPATDPVPEDLRVRLAEAERLISPGADRMPRLPRLAALLDKAEKFADQGRFDRAAAALAERHAILSELLGAADPYVIHSLTQLADLYETLGDRAAERRTLILAIDGAASCYGASDWRVTDLRRKLARAEKALRKDPEAERLEHLAAPLWADVRARSLSNDLTGMIEAVRRLSSLYREANDDEKYVETLEMEAIQHHELGSYPVAAALLLRVLPVKERLLRGKEHPEYARTVNRLGTLYLLLGQTEPGVARLREAFAIRKRTRREDNTFQQNHRLIMALVSLGQADGAASEREEALSILRELTASRRPLSRSGLEWAEELMFLSLIFHQMEDYQAAEAGSRRILAIAREVGDQETPTAQPVLAAALQGARVDATSLSAAALYSMATGLLGTTYLYKGEFEKANAVMQRDDRATREGLGEESTLYAGQLRSHALVFEEMGQHDRAATLAQQAVAILRKNLDWSFAGSTRNQQLTLTLLYREYLDEYLSVGVRAGLPADELYANVLAWKGAVFAGQRWIAEARADPKLAPVLAEWQDVTTRLVAAATLPETGAPNLDGKFKELQAHKERLESDLKLRSPEFRQKLALEQRKPADVQAVLPGDAALIDFVEYTHFTRSRKRGGGTRQRRLATFVLRPGRPVARFDLGPAADVERAVGAWRVAVGADAPPPGTRPGEEGACAAELRRLVWAPLGSALEGCATLLVSPDGALAGIPFGALPGERKQYLLQERRVAVVPAPRLLPQTLAPAATDAPPRTLVLLVTTGEAARPSLGEAVPVLDRIECTFRAAGPDGMIERLTGPSATASAFRAGAADSRVVFLMVHGFCDQRAGARPAPAPPALLPALLPGLSLPDPPGGSALPPELSAGIELADSRLTAAEVGQLALSTDLVVLASCQTARGLPVPGEGVQGLQQAFHAAGARTVVASLWEIPADATAVIMERFFSNLQRGMAAASALREAQLWVKSTGQGERFRPYYWAGLVVSGNPRLALAGLEPPRIDPRPAVPTPSADFLAAGLAGLLALGLGLVWRSCRLARRPAGW